MIGLIAALLAIGSAVWDALRYPEISAEATANPLLPFDTYFAVANGSTLFAMRDTQMFCGIDKVELIGGGGFQSFSVTDSKHATIEPGDPASFRCLLGPPGRPQAFNIEPGQVVSAHIFVRVTYRTLFKSREFA